MKKIIAILGIIIFTITLIISSYHLINVLLENRETDDSYVELIKDVVVEKDNKIDWEISIKMLLVG